VRVRFLRGSVLARGCGAEMGELSERGLSEEPGTGM
jgi:hypothetical protein